MKFTFAIAMLLAAAQSTPLPRSQNPNPCGPKATPSHRLTLINIRSLNLSRKHSLKSSKDAIVDIVAQDMEEVVDILIEVATIDLLIEVIEVTTIESQLISFLKSSKMSLKSSLRTRSGRTSWS